MASRSEVGGPGAEPLGSVACDMAIVGHEEHKRRLDEIEKSDLTAHQKLFANLLATWDQTLVEAFHEHDTVVDALRAVRLTRAADVLDGQGQP